MKKRLFMKIYLELSCLRDKKIPEFLRNIIDWMRYEIFWKDGSLFEEF